MVVKYRRRISRNGSGLEITVFTHWWTLLHYLKVLENKLRLGKFLATLSAILATVVVLPIILVIFAGLRVWRGCVQVWVWYRISEDFYIHPISIQNTHTTQTPFSTMLLSLNGAPSIGFIRKRIQENVEHRDVSGKLVHPNLQRYIQEIYGYYVWRQYENFQLKDHVIEAPLHFHGRSVSSRNIQEYISELCSEPLKTDLPPWMIFMVQGVDESGDPTTWLIIRVHHLLADNLSIHDLFITKYPNPWSSSQYGMNSFWNHRDYGGWVPLFSAPSATKELLGRTISAIIEWLFVPFFTIRDIINVKIESTKYNIYESMNTFNLKMSYEFSFMKRQYSFILWILQFSDTLCHLPILFYQQMTNISAAIQPCQVIKNIGKTDFKNVAVTCYWWIIDWFRSGIQSIRKIDKNYLNLVKESVLEIYWVIRAAVSLPRLLLEELLIIYRTEPIPIWNRRTQRFHKNRVNISWSEGVPLSSASEIKGITGASLSSVLLTATTGAVRDLVRACGIPPPDTIQCTLPLYSPTPYQGSSYGLLPLALPTGCSSSNTTLRSLRTSLGKMRKYPERYLASIWLTQHIMDFLPRILRSVMLTRLSAAHPVLLTNLMAPQETVQLWGYDVASVMYWRPPQHHAVVSVCVSSYCGRVYAGVVADAAKVSCSSIVPQSFVTHLNELAVDTGVKLERTPYRSKSRNNSPYSTPIPTPPPTPNLRTSPKFDFYHTRNGQHKFTGQSIGLNFQYPTSPLCNYNRVGDNLISGMETPHVRISDAVSLIPKSKFSLNRRRKSDISANSWDIIKQSIKGF